MKKDLRYTRHRFTYTQKSRERAVMRLFRECHGYTFDFKNPQTLNEKIAVRKLSQDPRLPILADKYAVRDYVRQTVGEEYLVPLYFHGIKFTKEDFQKLPRQCVIKTANASSTNILIFDKEKESPGKIINQVKRMQKIRYGFYMMEMFYNAIPPRVIVEEMLLDDDGNIPRDYKFHCFPHADNGKGKLFIQVDFGRFGKHTRNLYDENWNLLPFRHAKHPTDSEGVAPPEKLKEMLEIVKKLAQEWEYVRVDLYYTRRKIYFGEMTFTPSAATGKFDPPEYDKIWGDEWK